MSRWTALTLVGSLALTGCDHSGNLRHDFTASRGRPNFGWLQRGVAIAERGPGFVRARPGEDTRWGTPALVAAITNATGTVHAQLGGEPLRVGDLGARRGGRHRRHGSHRSGRDVDLIPYVVDAIGRSVQGRGFLSFDRFGVALNAHDASNNDVDVTAKQIGMRMLDLRRNWLLVRTLLLDEQAQVQWIFCSKGMKALLLRHAADHETDPEVLVRASYVLHQPTVGQAHDDHFHVRVMCNAEELANGCDDYGPVWPWLPLAFRAQPFAGVVTNDDASLIHALMDEQPTW